MISSLRRLTAMAAAEEGPVARVITQKLKDRFKVSTREVTVIQNSVYRRYGNFRQLLMYVCVIN